MNPARLGAPPRSFGLWSVAGVAAALPLALLAILSPILLAVLLSGVVLGLAVARWPWLGFGALVASVPLQQFGAMGGLTLTRLCFPLAIAALVASITVHRQRLRGHIVLAPFAALLVVMVISVFDADDIGAGLTSIGSWLVALAALVLALHFLAGQSVRRITLFVGILAAAGVFEAAFGVIQSFLMLGPASFLVTGAVSRAFGTFGMPNSYAGFLAIVFFPSFWLGIHFATRIPAHYRMYMSQRRDGMLASRHRRWILARTILLSVTFLGASAIIMSGIVASYSRGAWLGVAVAGLATALVYHRLTRVLAVLALPLLAIVVLGGGSGLIPASISERLSTDTSQLQIYDVTEVRVTDENFATVERLAHWQAGWRMFEEDPVLGVGAGNFNERYSEFSVRPGFRTSRGHAHNYYIHTLAETGVLGLLAYLTLILGLLALALRSILGMAGGFWRMLTIGAFGTVVSVSVHNLVENLHVLNLGIVLSTVWALIIVAHLQWRANAAAEEWNPE